MTTCVTFSLGATSCRRAALGTFARTRCSAPWACCSSASAAMLVPCREPATKPVGKPDAGNPHVRFDERGGETNRRAAPRLSSTLPCVEILALRCRGPMLAHPVPGPPRVRRAVLVAATSRPPVVTDSRYGMAWEMPGLDGGTTRSRHRPAAVLARGPSASGSRSAAGKRCHPPPAPSRPRAPAGGSDPPPTRRDSSPEGSALPHSARTTPVHRGPTRACAHSE